MSLRIRRSPTCGHTFTKCWDDLMLSNPRPGLEVRLHYRASLRPFAPWHGRRGIVRIAGKGKPRNHVIEIDGRLIVVPCGHLRSLSS